MSVFLVVVLVGLVVINLVEGGRAWLHRSLAALSQALNVWVFRGRMGESVSSRCYREGRSKWVGLIDGIFKVFFREDDHCWNTYLNDYERAVQTRNTFEQRYPDWE